MYVQEMKYMKPWESVEYIEMVKKLSFYVVYQVIKCIGDTDTSKSEHMYMLCTYVIFTYIFCQYISCIKFYAVYSTFCSPIVI
jgi:hypothetical protein